MMMIITYTSSNASITVLYNAIVHKSGRRRGKDSFLFLWLFLESEPA
jgi:hypothetical protein